MTALGRVTDWLACPLCHGGMQLLNRALVCEQRHGFDVARQGYVNLLGRAAPQHADTAAMVAARDRFLSAGHYSPITDAVTGAVGDAGRVLEVGAGTGHYIAAALAPGAAGLAMDISVPACRRAARVHPALASIVADTWAGLPLRDASVDVLLCVFAPRNAGEFRRVLRPGGRIVIVVPNAEHLVELRQEHGLLGIDDDKVEQLEAAFGSAAEVRRVAYDAELDAAAATDIVAMGPNAFHGAGGIGATKVTIDVSIVEFSPTLMR